MPGILRARQLVAKEATGRELSAFAGKALSAWLINSGPWFISIRRYCSRCLSNLDASRDYPVEFQARVGS